jgi:hypothetical protein
MDKYEIKRIVGDYCEGCITTEEEKSLIRKSLNGAVDTIQGKQRYYVDLDTIILDNIDYAEAIWSIEVSEKYRGNENDILYLEEISNSKNVENKLANHRENEVLRECLHKKIVQPLLSLG